FSLLNDLTKGIKGIDQSLINMGYCPLILELLAVFALTFYLLNKYGKWRKQSIVVSVATFMGWYMSFIIICVLPLDVVITFYNRCLLEKERVANTTSSSTGPAANISFECEPPTGYVPDEFLLSLWRIVYWSAQLMTWLILPLMQSYSTAGDFTSLGRMRTALVNNAIYYGIYLIIFILLVIYAVFKGIVINTEHLKVILVSASNTWGLLLLVGLLGYGLVEVPRQLWYTGRRDYRLNKVYFKLDQKVQEKNDAEDSYRDAFKEARSVLNAVKNDHFARSKAQMIVSKFDESVVGQLFPSRSGADFATLTDADPMLCTDDKYLIRLHQRSIEVIQMYNRANSQWKSLMEEALFYEDIQQAALTGQLSTTVSPWDAVIPSSVRYSWHVALSRPLAKVFGVILASMTVFILISECTFFIVDPTLSPAALLLQTAAQKFHYTSTQLVSFALLTYICCCAYSTLFRLRIYKYYHLDSHGLTDENSLLFSAALLCRLTPPICLNLLGLIHLDSHISHEKNHGVETQFTKLMGHLDLLPILAKGINIYLPFLILLFCALTYYKLGTRLLHSIGMDQFIDSDDVTMDAVSAGKALVQLERNKRGRRENRPRLERSTERATESGRSFGWKRQREEEENVPFVEREEIAYDEVPPPSITRGGSSLGPSPWNEHPSPRNIFDDM
ncbi:hypothetical protein PMAYCL1PPCAC_07035, partial [Pristionchus mayeri]